MTNRTLLLFLFAGGLLHMPATAQDRATIPVFNSPDGPVVLFGGSSITSGGKDNEGTHFALSRAESAGGGFRPLPLTGMVKDMQAFKKLTGAAFVSQLQHQLKLGSEEALWAYLQQHPDLSAYGMISFLVPFRAAMGAAYVDEEVKGQKGRTYTYKIDVDGSGSKASFSSSITIGQAPDFAAAVLTQARAKDSIVSIRWRMRLQKDIPYLATVYRQTGGKGEFQQLSARILATHKGDSAIFLFTEQVTPQSAYRYFIRPSDLLENAGSFTSDTANVIAADFRKLPFITNVKTQDTMNGILLSWKPLAANPLITGIEIQRSRDSRGDYVIIDTVSALSDNYMDRKLLPHVAYYYRLTVLHGGKQLQSEKFYSAASADQQKTSHLPDAPYGLSVQSGPKGVLLHWQPVNDPDLYAYYVYRGTNLDAAMEVISPSLTDTIYMDTTSNLSRQTAYVYAVKAVSNAGKESPWSEKIAAHLSRGKERPLTPGGIKVLAREGHLFIQWDDVKRNDRSILGYILYKHPAGQTLTYDVSKPASEEASRLQLQLAVGGALTAPYFEDTLPSGAGKWEYLVSTIDLYGAESGLSPVATYNLPHNTTVRPPAQLYARTVKEGVSLQWEQASAEGVEGFALYRRSINEKKLLRIARLKNNINQYTDRQVVTGTLYVYTVTAVTATGETIPSDEITVRPVK
jgi:hypothetical protein